MRVENPDRVYGHKSRIPPDSRAHKSWHYVPAIRMCGTSYVCGFLIGEVSYTDCSQIEFPGFEYGRTDDDLDFVLSSLPYSLGDIELMGNEHIVRRTYLDAVHKNVGKSVQPLEIQDKLLACGQFRSSETPAVDPLEAFIFSQFVDIAAYHRVLDKSCGKHIYLDISRNFGINGHTLGSGNPGRRCQSRFRLGKNFSFQAPLRDISSAAALDGNIIITASSMVFNNVLFIFSVIMDIGTCFRFFGIQ